MCFRKRFLAFIIDMILFMVLYMVINIIPFYDDYILTSSNLNKQYYIIYLLCCLILYAAFICKDAKGGQSIGKRIMKIRVVDKNKNVPNILKLIVRNITIFIWPVEAILVLLNKKKIGDRLTKTDVEQC